MLRDHPALSTLAPLPVLDLRLGAAWLEIGEPQHAIAAFRRAAIQAPGLLSPVLGLAAAELARGTPPAQALAVFSGGGNGDDGGTCFSPFPAALPLARTLTTGDPDGAEVEIRIGPLPPEEPDPGLYWWLGFQVARALGYGFAERACLRRAVLTDRDDLGRAYQFAEICLRVNGIGYLGGVWSGLAPELAEAPLSQLVAAAVAFAGDRIETALMLAQAVQRREPQLWQAAAIAGYALTMIAQDDYARREMLTFLRTGRRINGPSSAAVSDPAPDSAPDFAPGSAHARARHVLSAVIAGQGTAEAWNDLGHFHAALEELAAARACFERALTLNPTQRHAAINLAVVRLRQNDTATLPAYLRDTVFLASLPPSLAHRLPSAPPAPPDAEEWRRRTVFSYAWRHSLADLLAGGSGRAP